MGRIHIAALVMALGLSACGNKRDAGAAGSAIKDGACVAVVTPAKIQVVAAQQSRIEELGKLLDQVDTIGAPIELFDGIRQLDQWKALKARSARFAAIDGVADTLAQAVKTLRAFRGGLTEVQTRLGNLKGELDRVMSDPGSARKIEDVRAQVSSQLRGAVEPLSVQVQAAIRDAIVPLSAQLAELSDVVVMGCTAAKLSGGGEKMKDLCAEAKLDFAKALTYLDDVKGRPAKLFADVTSQLETELEPLIDAETRKLIDAAQVKVNEALRLPPTDAGSGSAGSASAGSAGSGSSH
ncbi:MAG: hypothetical protein E6J91_30615 [Deltaproteobacteria bacterium]|nr:MAG: hypothetical protein E6J91_30615 [Deltaproteobacteria bacterium]